MKDIRWGIIGCGNVTEVKSGPGFQNAKHSSLTAVMRRNGELAKDYAGRHGVPKWYDSAEELVRDPDVDAVYVATPPSSHREYTLLCAGAGKPVYVEKPMARNHEECLEMLEVCREAGVPLFVAYYRRMLPRFLKIMELVKSGNIGDVRFVTVNLYQSAAEDYDPNSLPWRVVPEIAGGGLFVDLASHILDFLDYVLGPIREVRGFASNQEHSYPAEDIVSGSFLFESGVHGIGTWCFTGFKETDITEIVGSRGKVSFSCFGSDPVLWTTGDGETEFPIGNPLHIQQPLIQTVVDNLTGTGTCPSTGESAARTNQVMDEMLREYKRCRE